MTLGIVFLDMLELRGFVKRGQVPVEMSQPLMYSRVTAADVTNVALEVLYVDRLECSDQHPHYINSKFSKGKGLLRPTSNRTIVVYNRMSASVNCDPK